MKRFRTWETGDCFSEPFNVIHGKIDLVVVIKSTYPKRSTRELILHNII